MELTDFLLARLAEIEDRARKLMRRAQEHDLVVRDPQHLGKFMPGWHEWRDIEADAERVLAECEAKRRIVDFYRAVPDGHQEHYRAGLGRALRCLALAYKDHPDYDPAWRP